MICLSVKPTFLRGPSFAKNAAKGRGGLSGNAVKAYLRTASSVPNAAVT